MSYFEENYSAVRYPIKSETSPGLRKAQLGAIHAIASTYSKTGNSLSLDSSIIVMPTGSGKTAVLMLSPFILQAKRVLIITPSRLVREQIANEFISLNQLRENCALETLTGTLNVLIQNKKLTTKLDWEVLNQYDVVVSTPNCVSPTYSDISEPPTDLFDLLLIDEAHHEPAITWQGIIKAFPKAKKILFTATPFRQDRKEIHGRIIYEYSIKDAFEDKIFGDLKYIPVKFPSSSDHDILIANKAEEVLREDRNNNLNHFLLVRTNTKKHAKKLVNIYQENTSLILKLIHGEHSAKYVGETVRKLKEKRIDGIICVDMMGEGFDFPNLKIAAIHAPHKSLGITLQFVGRFARINAPDIGQAKFIAIPQDLKIETEKLYKEGKIWQEIIPELYQLKLDREISVREDLSTFGRFDSVGETELDLKDISLYSLTPYFHVKIIHIPDGIDFTKKIHLSPIMIEGHFISEELNSLILFTKELEIPKWANSSKFAKVEYDLIVVYYDENTNLLFINSSRRADQIYDQISSCLANGEYAPLPLWKMNKVLVGVEKPEFFNIGMRNRIHNNQNESYRIIAGAQAHRAILRSDGRLYNRGHVFGKGGVDGTTITIGYSSTSKAWSNYTSNIPEFIRWCRQLAKRIESDIVVTTGSELDNLSVGEQINHLPDDIYWVDWNEEVYTTPPLVIYNEAFELTTSNQLLDMDLQIESLNPTDDVIVIRITDNQVVWKAKYSFRTSPYFTLCETGQPELIVRRNNGDVNLIDYLNNYPLYFYTINQEVIVRNEIFRPNQDFEPLNIDNLIVIDWDAQGVDIETEFGDSKVDGKLSLHDYLRNELQASSADIVFYDHGSGEIADFVTFATNDHENVVSLYHVKKSGGKNPGVRVTDVYEVCSQAVKSITWLKNDVLLKQVKHRLENSSQFIKGDYDQLERLITKNRMVTKFEIVIVQPGITKSLLPEKIANVLASSVDYLTRGGISTIKVWSSQ